MSFTSHAWTLTFSAHDNAKFASCGGDKIVFVWDVASGVALRKLQGHFGKLHAVAFNNDGGLLASGEILVCTKC